MTQRYIAKIFMNRFLFVLISLFVTAIAFAQDAAVPAGSTAPGAGQPQAPGFLGMVAPFALMFAVFYFLMIRPQQKKIREQQTMLSQLKHGDQVVTTSGMLGKVAGVTEKVVTLEVDDGVKVKMLKSQVAQVVNNEIKDLA